jgi:hypothetical protein
VPGAVSACRHDSSVPPIEGSSSVHPVSIRTAGRPSERAVTHIGGLGNAVASHSRSQTRDSQAITGNQWAADKLGDAHWSHDQASSNPAYTVRGLVHKQSLFSRPVPPVRPRTSSQRVGMGVIRSYDSSRQYEQVDLVTRPRGGWRSSERVQGFQAVGSCAQCPHAREGKIQPPSAALARHERRGLAGQRSSAELCGG